MRRALPLLLMSAFTLSTCAAVRPYAGAVGGIATLSADAGSRATAQGLSLSSYAPENGAAGNIFAGLHLHNYFSVQANYIWNRNDLLLNSTLSPSTIFYQQTRISSQHAAIFDSLIYFRRLSSRVRPYLSIGTGVVHFSSMDREILGSGGMPALPPVTFSSNRPVLRVAVGIDVALARKLVVRYSFSETIGKNDISKQLSPPAPRGLANFQNLFGFVIGF
jgi:outer membrane protein W